MALADLAAYIMLALAVILIFLPIVALHIFHESAGRTLLHRWAERSGLTLLKEERRRLFFTRGPFTWGTGRYQTVYRILVLDQKGQERAGCVRCGDFCWGLFLDRVEARWDDEIQPTPLKPQTTQAKPIGASLWDRELDEA